MIWPLVKHNIFENRIIIIAFTLIIMMYATISIIMFDPESVEAMETFLNMMPEGMIQMMGFNILGTEITSYLSNYMYGFILILFPIIFLIMLGTKLVSKHVDSGSMQSIITTPYTRKEIIITQLLFYILAFLFVLGVNIAIMIFLSASLFPGDMDIVNFLLLNLVTICVHLLAGSIVFFISVSVSDTSRVIAISSSILIIFFILNMLSKLGDATDFLKFITIYRLIDIDYILSGGSYTWLMALAPFLLSIFIFIASIIYFDKKNLIL